MDDKKWIEGIDRKMEGFEMPPPKNLWESIEQEVRPGLVKHKTIRMHYNRAWAVAAMLTGALVIGGGVWLSIHQEGNLVPRPMVGKTQNVSGRSSFQETRLDLAKAEVDHPAQVGNVMQRRETSISKDLSDNSVLVGEAEVLNSSSCRAELVSSSSQQEESKTSSQQPSQRSNPAKYSNTSGSHSWDNKTLFAARRSREEKFSVSLAASNFMSSNSGHEGYGELLTGSIWPDNSDGEGDDVSDDFGSLEEVIVGNNEKDVYTKKKHRQPIKVGVSVSYHLSDRWSVGTGLTYSYLSSDLTSGTDNSHYTTHQKLQYVGIPLNLSYVFYQHKRWSVYGTTGGMVEKCVKGKSTTDFTVNGKEETPRNDDVEEKKLQYSVNAAVGVQAKIANHVGFYLEPGLSYHFDNHSNVTNIYKDTPLNFSLGMGFRYSF